MTPPTEASPWLANLVDLTVILMLVLGIGQFRTPKRAKAGNWIAAVALGVAIFLVLSRHGVHDPLVVVGASILGALIGVIVAFRVDMTSIPSMVALQHGMGGVAAFLVSIVEMMRDAATLGPVAKVSGFLGLIVGAATFSGSMLAALKLANKVKQAPTRLPGHNLVLLALIAVVVGLSAAMWDLTAPGTVYGLVAIVALSMVLGHVFAMRIGGADMPVLISFLNATAGVAAAFCGVIIGNRLLIAAGATVASSGSILTHVMCKAMNRGLGGVFLGSRKTRGRVRARNGAPDAPAANVPATAATAAPQAPAAQAPAAAPDGTPLDRALARLSDAKRIIVIPGYGMALAKAQFDVVRLATFLERQGKDVKFAIHPVAGRMPGHMNVLLAEADVDYEKLVEMDDVNRDFPDTDVVLVVGACDVVNPAANDPERDTPLSGMPILEAHHARCVIVCNLDERPGYSGVDNPLYADARTLMLLGDALGTLRAIRRAIGDTQGLEPA
jgi:NAD(P) transhydrogenase subunit beta